jgi:hypothetical protein
MRLLKYALALMLPAGILLAASPFAGNWKMNHDKSKYTKGAVLKDETMAISDQGEQIQGTITGTDDGWHTYLDQLTLSRSAEARDRCSRAVLTTACQRGV